MKPILVSSIGSLTANSRRRPPYRLNSFSRFDDRLQSATARLRDVWRWRFKVERVSIERNRTGLKQGTRKLLDLARSSLSASKSSLAHRMTARVAHARGRLERASSVLAAAPKSALRLKAQHLVSCKRRCRTSANRYIEETKQRLSAQQARFHEDRYLDFVSRCFEHLRAERQRVLFMFARAIESRRQHLSMQRSLLRLNRIVSRLTSHRSELQSKLRVLRSTDPKNSLRRGFSLTYDETGRLVKSIGQLHVGAS